MKSKESSLIWRSAHCNEMLVIFDIIIYLLYTFISLCTTNKAYCKINSIKEKLIGICILNISYDAPYPAKKLFPFTVDKN